MRAHGDSLFGPNQVYTAEGVKINGRIVRGLSTMWAAAGGRSSMYVCIVNGSQKKNGSMVCFLSNMIVLWVIRHVYFVKRSEAAVICGSSFQSNIPK